MCAWARTRAHQQPPAMEAMLVHTGRRTGAKIDRGQLRGRGKTSGFPPKGNIPGVLILRSANIHYTQSSRGQRTVWVTVMDADQGVLGVEVLSSSTARSQFGGGALVHFQEGRDAHSQPL
jgi:hypothetical protein